MQFNKKVILAISVTASVVVYLTHHSSSKQQQKQQQQHYDVLERVFALHFNSTTKEDRRSMIQNDDNNIAQKISSSSSGYRDSSADSRNLFNIIGMMGGELEVDEEEGPWGDYSQYMTLYSSTPFNPRQYSGEDTEFLHYKDPTEQDKDGTTTFPPTNKPIQQNTWDVNAGKPSADPTEFPTSFPVTLEPTKEGETRHPTREPTRRPTKLPTREPTKFPTKEVRFGISMMNGIGRAILLWQRKSVLTNRITTLTLSSSFPFSVPPRFIRPIFSSQQKIHLAVRHLIHRASQHVSLRLILLVR